MAQKQEKKLYNMKEGKKKKKKERNYKTVKTNLNHKFKTIFTLRQSFD